MKGNETSRAIKGTPLLDGPNAVVLEGGGVEKAAVPGQWGGGERREEIGRKQNFKSGFSLLGEAPKPGGTCSPQPRLWAQESLPPGRNGQACVADFVFRDLHTHSQSVADGI